MKQNKFFNKIYLSTVIFTFILGILTLYQAGTLTNKVYLIKNTEKKLEKLSKENQTLEDMLLSFKSLNNVEEFLKEVHLVKAKNIKYIQTFESTALAK